MEPLSILVLYVLVTTAMAILRNHEQGVMIPPPEHDPRL